MWSGSNSGQPCGGEASVGYAGLVVWVGSGVGGRGRVFSVKTPISLLNRLISLQIKQNKLGVLLVFDFITPTLCANFSLAGKQSLVSATTKLKLFPKRDEFVLNYIPTYYIISLSLSIPLILRFEAVKILKYIIIIIIITLTSENIKRIH
jgi:hypothetical protein